MAAIFTAKSHHISLNLTNLLNHTKCDRISSNLAKSYHISHRMSQNLTYVIKSHRISPNKLTESYKILPYLTETHQISSHWISQNLTVPHRILPDLIKFHPISPKLNIRVGLHVGQYMYYQGQGDVFFPPRKAIIYFVFKLKVYQIKKIDKSWHIWFYNVESNM